MKRLLAALLLIAATVMPAAAQTYSDIDVDLPYFPEMQPIPDSPVYWAPGVDSNYFFYDGLFWDYHHDLWHWSAWYNGPWMVADPVYVPTYVLWVPVRYYHKPAHHFHGIHPDKPPRWGQHWGRDWQARHNQVYSGLPTAWQRAPLPRYQSIYNRANYPRGYEQQRALHAQHYTWQPREGTASMRQPAQNRGATTKGNPADRSQR
jgi:hypothetical protein